MGWDYALVHLKYTIPPALALTFIYRPLLTRLDVYKITFLIIIAVVSTIPWDAYLIRNRIWTYPPDVIVGPTLFSIPAEELFFFVIQTYNTTFLYLLLNKATFRPVFLRAQRGHDAPGGATGSSWVLYKLAGQLLLGLAIRYGFMLVRAGAEGKYMGLIIVWAGPFLLFLWSLAYQFILGLPSLNTLVPILLPTLYLWVVDTLALRRGTWVIEKGTKCGLQLWDGLEIEEAIFFLLTNTLVVFGLVAFDNALAVLHTFPEFFPETRGLPSPVLLVRALLWPASHYDEQRITGLAQAVLRLRKKSRSFYLASGTFEGRLRIDLIKLYSFCRAADDLIDDAASAAEAKVWIDKLRKFLELNYSSSKGMTRAATVREYVRQEFPLDTYAALLQLPTEYIPKQPLQDLLSGFEMDLAFSNDGAVADEASFPIQTENDLDLYGARVAGTVAELCIQLVFHHTTDELPPEERQRLLRAGVRVGIALQCVNIARDIAVDAAMGRVYLPTSWLKEEELTAEAVAKNPSGARIEALRLRLLNRAFDMYEEARDAVEELPPEARGPIRVAVESYMEIGRVLRQPGYAVKAGRATVPKWRRLRVAWAALSRG